MEIKRWGCVLLVAVVVLTVAAAAELTDTNAAPANTMLDRSPRAAARNKGGSGATKDGSDSCRYARGAWSECDSGTNLRTRTLTLKKGDPASCERTKTIQKKCKKACRYEKAAWSACGPSGEQTRTDVLRTGSDSTCEPRRTLTRKCSRSSHQKPTKDKGRRNRQ